MSKVPTPKQVHDALVDEDLLPAHRLVLIEHEHDRYVAAERIGINAAEVQRIRELLLRRACKKLGIDLDEAIEEDMLASGKMVLIPPEGAPYTVQDMHPSEQPEWANRYSGLTAVQAKLWFESINIGFGWCKRLLDKDGNVLVEHRS